MANYYLDTSALVKCYVVGEVGSAWVQNLTDRRVGNLLLLSQLALVEVAAALARKEREREITPEERRRYLGLFVWDCRRHQYHLLPNAETILRQAADLTYRRALRAYDAIHLATALQANQLIRNAGAIPLTFVSADSRLCAAGQDEGLMVDNPLDHLWPMSSRGS